MNPLVGLILIVLWSVLNAVIAAKRGRNARAFFAWSIVPVIPMAMLTARLAGEPTPLAGWAAFLPPLVTCIAVFAMENGQERAARTGQHGNYIRCPFCAEPVRREAVKCRHCASDLTNRQSA